jgi:hypothetical protein
MNQLAATPSAMFGTVVATSTRALVAGKGSIPERQLLFAIFQMLQSQCAASMGVLARLIGQLCDGIQPLTALPAAATLP